MHFECRHIMPNGARCHCPAMRGKPYCYFHLRLHQFKKATPPTKEEPFKLNVMEDRSAIQVAVAQVLDALGSARLEPRVAGLFLYGIQLVSQNVERKQDILPFYTVESMTKSRGGVDMAPASFICNDGDDCSTCPQSDDCKLECRHEDEDDDKDIHP